MDESILSKYSTKKKKGVPRSERAEIADKTAQLLNQDIKKVLGWTRHLQPDQMYRLYQESNGKPQFWWTNYKQKYSKNNMTKLMIERLTKIPQMRERKYRGKYLAKWALMEVFDTSEDKKNNVSLLTKYEKGDKLDFVQMGKYGIRFSSLDRDWRDTQRLHPELRGTDYEEKDILEEIELKRLNYR